MADMIDVILGKSLSGTSPELLARVDTMERQIADLNYKEISITAFSHNAGTKERGETVETLTLSWNTSKTPATLALDGEALAVTEKSKTLTGLGITWNKGKTWKLTATDERGAKAEKTTSVGFFNGLYYGTAALPAAIDSAFVMGLENKLLTDDKNRTVSAVGGAGLYFWYAYPARLGTSLFNMGGFDYEFECTAILMKNGKGYEEDYYIYRSGQQVPAALSVTVKKGV